MTPEEVQAYAKELYDQYDKGYISAKQLRDGLNDASKGVKNYTQELNASLNQLGTSIKSTFEDIKDGKKGAGVFNRSLNSGADTVAKAAMQFGPLGVAIGAVVKVLTFFVTAATDQADALYKANEDLGKIGAAGAGGMTEIYSNLKQFGYGIADLGDMTALLTQNSVALTNFSGTTSQGAKKLADIARGIQSTDLQQQFMNMGMSVNDINKGIAAYASQQSAFTTSEKKTTEQLKIGAVNYLQNLSKLSKLTGQSAEAMAQQREEALAIDAFNAALTDMNDEDRERQLERYNALAKINKDAALGYANQVSGFVGLVKQSNQLQMTTAGISNKLAKDSKIPLDQFMQSMADATKTTEAQRRSYALLGGTDTFLAYGKTQKLSMMAGGEMLKAMKAAKDQTDAQIAGEDKLTDTSNKMRRDQMDTRDAFENLLQKGVLPVSEAIEGLADFVDSIMHPIQSIFGGGTDRQKTRKEQAGLTAAEQAAGTGISKDTGARAADVASKLEQRGFSKTEAAAITGNLYAESTFSTKAINPASGASGLMQWTGARKDALKEYAKSAGKEWTDEGVQLDYIYKELKADNGYEANQFKKAMAEGGGDVAKSAYYFAKFVERPNASELAGSAGKRANMAVAVSQRPLTDVVNAQKDVPVVPGPKAATETTVAGKSAAAKTTVNVEAILDPLRRINTAQQAKNSAEKQIAMNTSK